MKIKIIILVICLFCQHLIAQNVGIGTLTPDATAQLDITATNKGLLIPRVALTGNTDVVTIPSPTISLLIYNTATAGSGSVAVTPGFYFWNGTVWITFSTANNTANGAWLLGGNAGTNPPTNFIGTSDNQALIFKINNTRAGFLGLDGSTYWGLNSGNSNNAGANNIAVGNYALASNTSGYSNVAMGVKALQFTTTKNNLVALGDSALYNNGIGAFQIFEATANVAVGSKALYKNTTGFNNTAVGYNAQYYNATGNNNTALGTASMFKNTSGARNTALGFQALNENTSGNLNVAVGNNSLSKNTNGATNTAVGAGVMSNNISGYSNVAIGVNALNISPLESNIVAIGDSALYFYNGANTSLPSLFGNNTAVGSKALLNSTTGTSNSAFGSMAMYNNDIGNFNVSIGGKSLYANISGGGNVAVGVNSLQQNTTGGGNIAIGRGAMYGGVNGSGASNIAIGTSALLQNVDGNFNVAIGSYALDSALHSSNTIAIGDSALHNYRGGDNGNVAVGSQALYSLSLNGGNTAIGRRALYKNQSAGNTALGDYALTANDVGTSNTGLGAYALITSYGDYNAAVGNSAMYNNTRGDENTALGFETLYNNKTGNRNVSIGKSTLAGNIGGSNNTAVGYSADVSAIGLLNATAIGTNALVACSNCMALGAISGVNGATANTKVGIGISIPQNTLHVSPNASGGILIGGDKTAGGFTDFELGISANTGGYSYLQSTKSSGSFYGDISLNPFGGSVGIHMNIPLSPLHIKQTNDVYPVVGGGLRLERNTNTNHWEMGTDNGDDLNFSFNNTATAYLNNTNGLLTSVSDLRMKKDINLIGTVLPSIMQLQPKTYHYKTNATDAPLSYGFIAQEVEKLFPDFVTTKGPDNMKAITYQEFTIVAN